jgi:regulator of sigma E protease
MEVILTIIYVLLILSVLVFVHELGHFMAARSIKLPVITFSIGMGPALKKWRWKRFGDTEFRISAIPFGGYCMVAGEEETTDSEGSFYSKTPWQRIWYASAGVLMNFALAIIILISVFAVVGPSHAVLDTNQIKFPFSKNPAKIAGIQARERILVVDGEYIDGYLEMAGIVNENPNVELEFLIGTAKEEPFEVSIHQNISVLVNLEEEKLLSEIDFENYTPALTIKFGSTLVAVEKLEKIDDESLPLTEENEINWIEVGNIISADKGSILLSFSETIDTRTLQITPKEMEDKNFENGVKGVIGVAPWTVRKSVSFFDAIWLGLKNVWQLLVLLWSFLVGLFKGKAGDVGGPKVIYDMTKTMVQFGLADVLEFMAMFSVNLGFINLVPFPGLDGGHIVANLFEGITKKKINRNVLNTVNYIGFLLLMGLMLFIVVRDFVIR